MLSAFKDTPLFHGLSADDFSALENCVTPQEYPTGTDIIIEGEPSTDLYLILSGAVEVLKRESGGKHEQMQFQLATLEAGESFGEMAFIDNVPRSSSVRAMTTSKLLQLSKSELQKISGTLYKKIIKNIAKLGVGRLRGLNNDYTKALYETLEHLQARTFFMYLFLVMLASLTIIDLIDHTAAVLNINEQFLPFSFSRMVLLVVPSIVMIKKLKIPLHELGITSKGWFIAILEGLFAGLMFSLVVLCVVFALRVYHHESLNFLPNVKAPRLAWLLVYPFHAYIQEFISRGVMQTSVQKILDDTKGYMAVLITSLLFAALHTFLGAPVVFITFVGSVGFGALYIARPNLLVVTAAHFVAGILGLSLTL